MKETIRTLRAALAGRYDTREAAAIARLLIEDAGIDRTRQCTCLDEELPAAVRGRLAAMAERVAAGEPVQYVLGYETFMGRRFSVDSSTLIPRPETAELVAWILSDIHNTILDDRAAPAPILLDAGTGSGCIAITLAAALPRSRVTAIDISLAALDVARRNAAALDVHNVTFAIADMLQDLPFVPATCDLIVSNPPYVTRSEAATMAAHVLDHEPPTALFVPDDDPLRFYRALARCGRRMLRAGGRLYVEIHARRGHDVCRLLAEEGYSQIELRTDLAGRDRMVRGTLL